MPLEQLIGVSDNGEGNNEMNGPLIDTDVMNKDHPEEVLSDIIPPEQQMNNFKEAVELSFSGKSPSYHSDMDEPNDQEEQEQVATQNKDDKLTQSQLLARMLAAEARDNERDRRGEDDRLRDEPIDQDKQEADNYNYGSEDEYISSGVTSSMDFDSEMIQQQQLPQTQAQRPKVPGLGMRLN